MPTPAPSIFPQFLDNDSVALDGGYIVFYSAGTTDYKDTYSNAAGTSVNENPLNLNSGGRPDTDTPIFFGSGAYDCFLYDAAGVLVASALSITAIGGSALSLQIVGSITEMTALPSGSSTYVLLTGYGTPGDGTMKIYYWSSTSTATSDALYVVLPNSSPAAGRWLALTDRDIAGSASGRAALSLSGTSDVAPYEYTTANVKGKNRLICTLSGASEYLLIDAPILDGVILNVWNASAGKTLYVNNVDGALMSLIISGLSGAFIQWDNTLGYWIT